MAGSLRMRVGTLAEIFDTLDDGDRQVALFQQCRVSDWSPKAVVRSDFLIVFVGNVRAELHHALFFALYGFFDGHGIGGHTLATVAAKAAVPAFRQE